MASLHDVVGDLVLANRILAQHGVLDTFGHISVRHPEDPSLFLMAAMKSPALVTRNDIVIHSVETGDPISKDAMPPGPRPPGPSKSERHIHAGLFRARPEVKAALHCHAPVLVSFSILPPHGRTQLKPVLHVGASTGKNVPVYDIATNNGPATDMLIRTPALGDDLAKTFMENKGCDLVLMRGHGATIASTDGVRDLVHKGIYAVINANILKDATLMAGPGVEVAGLSGGIVGLSEGEVEACDEGLSAVFRSWPAWVHALGPDAPED